MQEEILAAVMFLIKFIEKSESFPHDQIDNFKHHLTTLLLERFEKHWFPERPARGQGYRCIRVNGISPVDGTLERAASRCGLRYRDLRLPQELTVWVDPAEVCYRLGESEGSYCTLATFPILGGSADSNLTTTTTSSSLITNHTSTSSLSLPSSLSNSSSSNSSTISSTSTSSTTSTSSVASSETSSDCASLSSRSPSPLTSAAAAAPVPSSVYQGPMRRSPFTVNGTSGNGNGARFLRGVQMPPVQQQQQQQVGGSCRSAMQQQQQQQQHQRFMQQQQQQQQMGGFNALNGAGSNRLKPREMGYNLHNMQPQQQQQQQQQQSTNNRSTNNTNQWRLDGPPTGGAFAPGPMFNQQQFNGGLHNGAGGGGGGGGNPNNHFNSQQFRGSSSAASMATMAPNGNMPSYNNRMYKNVVRV